MFVNKQKEIFDCSTFSEVSEIDVLKETVCYPHSSVAFITNVWLITTEIKNCSFKNITIRNVRNIPTFVCITPGPY